MWVKFSLPFLLNKNEVIDRTALNIFFCSSAVSVACALVIYIINGNLDESDIGIILTSGLGTTIFFRFPLRVVQKNYKIYDEYLEDLVEKLYPKPEMPVHNKDTHRQMHKVIFFRSLSKVFFQKGFLIISFLAAFTCSIHIGQDFSLYIFQEKIFAFIFLGPLSGIITLFMLQNFLDLKVFEAGTFETIWFCSLAAAFYIIWGI